MVTAGNTNTREQNMAAVLLQPGRNAPITPDQQKILDTAKQQTAISTPGATTQLPGPYLPGTSPPATLTSNLTTKSPVTPNLSSVPFSHSSDQMGPLTQAQQLQQAQGQGQGLGQNNNSDLINKQYDANYASQLQKLQEARQTQQQGLNQQETSVNQNAMQNLNNNDTMANQQLKQLQEVMANNGIKGGDVITSTIGNQTAQQQGANQINQDKANQLNNIQQQRSQINNNASADDLALMQQLQGTRSGQLIDNNNTQDQRALQLAQLMGKDANGNNTLGGNQLALQQQGQGFTQNLQTNQFNQGVKNDAFSQGLQTKQFDLNSTQAMAQLTGYISDGKGGFLPTNAKQQLDLTNAWTEADKTGKVTANLAALTGLPVGAPTEAAKQFSQSLAIQQQNADSSSLNASTSAKNSTNNMNNNQLDQLYKQWDSTGKAPAGIPGVTEGTPLYDKTGARQDASQKDKDGKLTVKAYETERDGMLNAVRTGKTPLPDAMAQINQDEQLGIYAPDLAERLRGNLRVLANGQPVPGDPAANGPTINTSGIGIKPLQSVTGSAFGG